MPREPLYPHVPGKREPLFPHVPKSRQLAGKVTRLPQTEKGKYAWWILDPETGEIMINEGFTTPEKAKISAKAYAIQRARWVVVLPKRVVELRIYDRPPDIEHSEIGIVFKGHILTPEGKIVEVPEHPLPQTLPQTGTCYEDAWRFLIKEEEGELVHGSVQTIGKRIDHAWVETETGFVWEPESGEFMNKNYFIERAQPQVEVMYSPEEAAIMAARTKNFGPWSQQERHQYLGVRLPQTKEKLYQRGPDGYPIGADKIMRDAWGPIPDPDQPFWSGKGFIKPTKIYGWQWAPDYNCWRAYVKFPDGTETWTSPRSSSISPSVGPLPGDVASVICPICKKVIKIPQYNVVTRSDALKEHLKREHSKHPLLLPQVTVEGGEPVSPEYRHLVNLVSEPLPKDAY